MLLDWRGHITVDAVRLARSQLMQRGRMLCSMQAWWFIWGYQNYRATEPSAKLIKVKLPCAVDDLAYEEKTCDLGIYFARPDDVPEMDNLTYTEFFALYDYIYKLTTKHFVRRKYFAPLQTCSKKSPSTAPLTSCACSLLT